MNDVSASHCLLQPNQAACFCQLLLLALLGGVSVIILTLLMIITPKQTRLPNGFRLVTIDQPGRRSVTNFLVIRSGSRYETGDNNGIAHFLEHLVFKGTKSYPNNEAVAQAIEGVGGTLNAWTDFDHTAYWNIVPTSEWRVGLDLPLELAFQPQLRAEDLERERGVIIEEIRMLQDDPARYVHDLATEQLFAGNPLGQPIIGNEQTITAMKLEQFRDYKERFYTPAQAVFAVVGDLSDKDVAGVLTDKIRSLKARPLTKPERLTTMSARSLRVLNKPTDQTHFVLGVADPGLGLERTSERYTAMVLNTILGKGMSSRLFMNVREKKGLAYSIYSHLGTLEDAGTLTIYGGVNTTKVDAALNAVREELDSLASKVSVAELQKAKRNLIGTNDIQADQGLSLAMWYGTDWLLGRWETHEEVTAGIEAVSTEGVQQLAAHLFKPEHQTLSVVGPYKSDATFARFLNSQ